MLQCKTTLYNGIGGWKKNSTYMKLRVLPLAPYGRD